MRYLNRKYKKQCITCKKFNSNEKNQCFNCNLDNILKKLQEQNATEEEVQQALFDNSCDSFENFFFIPTRTEEIQFEEFEYNVQKDNMSQKVRICHPEDESRNTFVGYNLGFLPLFPELEFIDKTKLKIYNNFDLAFYIPDLNIIVFNCESIWYPLNDAEQVTQITEEEKEYFLQNKENIITIFYDNLFKNTIENDLIS